MGLFTALKLVANSNKLLSDLIVYHAPSFTVRCGLIQVKQWKPCVSGACVEWLPEWCEYFWWFAASSAWLAGPVCEHVWAKKKKKKRIDSLACVWEDKWLIYSLLRQSVQSVLSYYSKASARPSSKDNCTFISTSKCSATVSLLCIDKL